MRPVIIVSGASSSLGKVLCELLSENGFKVYAGYNKNKVSTRSGNVIPFLVDITNNSSCHQAIKGILKSEKKIFALINLVAISPSGETLNFSPDDFLKILDTNSVGPYRLIYGLLPHLPKNGRIINIGSLSGIISFPRFSLYSASKFALRAMSLSLYYEWLPKKRFITHIAPGAMAKHPIVPPPKGSARDRVPLINWLLPLISQDKVSKIILNCLKDPTPPAEILVGRDTAILSLIRRLSPVPIWDNIQNFVWKKQQ